MWCDGPVTAVPSASALTELATQLATGAGDLIRAHRHDHFAVDTKSTPTDVVTEVDRAVEAYIRGELARRRPDDAVLGEEGGGRTGSSGVGWLVDPIDGTVNFVLGLPQYAVSIAAEVDGRIVAACVHNPVSRELFRATVGGGAFVGDERLRGPRDVPVQRAVVGTGFGYDAALRGRQAAVAAALLPRVADIRRLGSAALDLCAVAAGRLDAYFEVGLNPWDWSAGALIAHETGCVVSGLRGREPSGQMVAVAGAALAPHLFDLLEDLGADVS
jgi:myo-inositol-1(or 4)-monophosphatase